MIEKIKNKIDEMKKDETSLQKYVKSFYESKKANELFSSNDEFNGLKEGSNNSNKKEDEYF